MFMRGTRETPGELFRGVVDTAWYRVRHGFPQLYNRLDRSGRKEVAGRRERERGRSASRENDFRDILGDGGLLTHSAALFRGPTWHIVYATLLVDRLAFSLGHAFPHGVLYEEGRESKSGLCRTPYG